MSLSPRLASIAALAAASVGIVFVGEETRSGRTSSANPLLGAPYGRGREPEPRPKPIRERITHFVTPQPLSKRAKRRAKGRAK